MMAWTGMMSIGEGDEEPVIATLETCMVLSLIK